MRMFRRSWFVWVSLLVAAAAYGQEMHDHGVPEKLGKVTLPISCDPKVQQPFDRAVALLHSFAYGPATKAFEDVAAADPTCAMAHWGVAMTYFHPVWAPALPPDTFASGQKEMLEATRLGAPTPREQQFIRALGELYKVDPGLKPAQRTLAYEKAMGELAHANPKDVEAQVFYAVALLSNAAPSDKTHAKQKQAIDILEPLFQANPDHPGIAHYLIHACDSAELAQRGLPAARKYASIAPSAPHALHMPSHIFTRLGLWDDSIQSNLASETSARAHGDTMGQLHAMDYLVYAYMQSGRAKEASGVVDEMRAMPALDMEDFGVAYAATAMPIRVAVEQAHWADARAIETPRGAPPSVVAIAVWAKGLGLARTGHPAEARQEANRLGQIATQLDATGDTYWSVQTSVLADEVMAWSAQANGDTKNAVALLTSAADKEDALEKRPVTPGPILPAREQLGDLLLAQNRPDAALAAFKSALTQSPGRAGALKGEAQATKPPTPPPSRSPSPPPL
jgi:tetratricopeptide (TPR) repeat protein